MGREDFVDFSTEEIEEEIKRRLEIKNAPWPRTINIKGWVEYDNLGEVEENLRENGFGEGTSAYNNVWAALSGMTFELEFNKEGHCKLISVNNNKIECCLTKGKE